MPNSMTPCMAAIASSRALASSAAIFSAVTSAAIFSTRVTRPFASRTGL